MPSKSNKPYQRVMLVGVDGLPYSFAMRRMAEGGLPCLRKLCSQGALARMRSCAPPVSSTAWTCIMTGRNPAAHRIFGFVDRSLDPFETFIPTAGHRAVPALWDTLGRRGKHVVIMNIPVTFPPLPVNGKLVSCFLAADLKNATYPPGFAGELAALGYVIDVDPALAHQDKSAFLDALFNALDRRLETTLHLMEREPWDFFAVNIMESDRIAHFFWEEWENGHPEFAPRFIEFFERVDAFLGAVRERLPGDAALVVLSDHGFCALKKEVNLNHALMSAGLLRMNDKPPPRGLGDMAPDTQAYSLIPGRVFINLKGREPHGAVAPGAGYEKARERVAQTLLALKDPDNGAPLIAQVHRSEDIYRGPFLHQAADLIVLPHDGYDLKAGFDKPSLTDKGIISGMHTIHDALLYVSGREIRPENLDVLDVAPSVLSLFGMARPEFEGRNCFL